MINNFTINNLAFSIRIGVDKTAELFVFIEAIFTNIGAEILFIETGFNLGRTSCGSVSVTGPSSVDCYGGGCRSFSMGDGSNILKIDAGDFIKDQYSLGQCNFANVKPGLYRAEFHVGFYQHQDAQSKKAQQEYSFFVENNFEIPEYELVGQVEAYEKEL